MKHLLPLFLIILACSCKNTSPDPGITITPQIYLGKIVNGKKQTFVIKCTNNTSHSVKLREVNVPCTCLKIVGRYNRGISPRDTASFQFEYIPGGNSYTEKKIELYFNDSKIPLTAKISAHIKDSVQAPPGSVVQ